MNPIVIRSETKNKWERRTPLTPMDLEELRRQFDVDVYVQSSEIRCYADHEYESVGAVITDGIKEGKLVIGVKEIPIDRMNEEDKVYMFFSHTIKGQKDNMEILKKVMETKSTLIDYEAITDQNKKRLVYFGEYAGVAGALDMLWLLGLSYKEEGSNTVFNHMKQSVFYNSLDNAFTELSNISDQIRKKGIGMIKKPFVIGVMGVGNVYKGVMKILDRLPIIMVKPEELPELEKRDRNVIYVCVFEVEDIVRHREKKNFIKEEYYANPQLYESDFVKYLPYINALCNCMFWNKGYPHFISWSDIEHIYKKNKQNLRVISDIAGDAGGGIECNLGNTSIDRPYYSINPYTHTLSYDENKHILLTAVDNFPAEFPNEASITFSQMVKKHIPSILSANINEDFSNSGFSKEIKNAIVIYKGKLTERFNYLNQYL